VPGPADAALDHGPRPVRAPPRGRVARSARAGVGAGPHAGLRDRGGRPLLRQRGPASRRPGGRGGGLRARPVGARSGVDGTRAAAGPAVGVPAGARGRALVGDGGQLGQPAGRLEHRLPRGGDGARAARGPGNARGRLDRLPGRGDRLEPGAPLAGRARARGRAGAPAPARAGRHRPHLAGLQRPRHPAVAPPAAAAVHARRRPGAPGADRRGRRRGRALYWAVADPAADRPARRDRPVRVWAGSAPAAWRSVTGPTPQPVAGVR
jgi:hypothetical protein